MKLSEDQMGQLLSAFWIQANLPDNLPSNIEAIAHSFILTLIILRIKVVYLCTFTLIILIILIVILINLIVILVILIVILIILIFKNAMFQNLKDRDNLVIRFFQLPLSLWNMLLENNGMI